MRVASRGNKPNIKMILFTLSLFLVGVAISVNYIFSLPYTVTLPLIVLAILLFILKDINEKNKLSKKGLIFAGSSLLVGLAISLNNSFTLPLLFLAMLLYLLKPTNKKYEK